MDANERTPFLKSVVRENSWLTQEEAILSYTKTRTFRLYRRRWFMLLALGILNFSNAMVSEINIRHHNTIKTALHLALLVP